MPAAEENTENAYDDGNEECADKEIGGKRKGKARIAHAAEIEDGDSLFQSKDEPKGEPGRWRRKAPFWIGF
jgi:hypothetical protein